MLEGDRESSIEKIPKLFRDSDYKKLGQKVQQSLSSKFHSNKIVYSEYFASQSSIRPIKIQSIIIFCSIMNDDVICNIKMNLEYNRISSVLFRRIPIFFASFQLLHLNGVNRNGKSNKIIWKFSNCFSLLF